MDRAASAQTSPGGADVDRLPSLADVRPVPLGAVDEFRAKGHTVLRGLASADEVGAYRASIESTAAITRPLTGSFTNRSWIAVISRSVKSRIVDLSASTLGLPTSSIR